MYYWYGFVREVVREEGGGGGFVYNLFWINMKFVNMCEIERIDFI